MRERGHGRSIAVVLESKEYTRVVHEKIFLVHMRSRLRNQYIKTSKEVDEYFLVLVIEDVASNKCKVYDSNNNHVALS